jgi:hypothetical protein
MFLFGLDLLYFQPQADGAAFAIEESHIYNPQMRWGWGFRLTLGTPTLALKWLCLPIQNNTYAEGHLLPSWSSAPQDASSFVDAAKARWRLHLGLVDLEWQKKWDVSPYFLIKPRLGIRFASIRQKLHIIYRGGSLFPGEEDIFSSKNKYWGVGPEVGADLAWKLGNAWSLTGSSTFSGVTGGFYIHEAEREYISRVKHLNFFDCYGMGAIIWDYAIGIQWVRGITTLQASWEQHFFPSQNRLVHPPVSQLIGTGDLAVSGLSIGAKFAF